LEELLVVLDKGGGKVRVPHEARAGVEELEEGVVVVVGAFEDEALAYTGPERTRLLVHVVFGGNCVHLTRESSRRSGCEERVTEKGVVASTLAL
jgi:hypothetical protein